MCLHPLLGILIAGLNVEAVTVDLDIAAERHVCGGDEAAIVSVSVLVLAPLQELAFHYTGVLLCGLIYRD